MQPRSARTHCLNNIPDTYALHTDCNRVTRASSRLFIQTPSSPCSALATKRRRPHSGDGRSLLRACLQVSSFLQHVFSIAEMRNRLAAAEALNEYLRVRLHRLQEKDCSGAAEFAAAAAAAAAWTATAASAKNLPSTSAEYPPRYRAVIFHGFTWAVVCFMQRQVCV
jgi:hypothetical protein